MPRRLRSWFQTHVKRYRNTEDRKGSKDQEQSRPAPLLKLPTSTQHIPATPSTSTSRLPVTLTTGSIDIETSTPRSPAAPATGSANIETSAGADDTTVHFLAASATNPTNTETPTSTDDTTTSLPVRLWDRAYNELKQEEVKLVDSYEKILSRQLQDGPGSTVPESQSNTIAHNTLDRRCQMTRLINAGLIKTEREVKVKESLGVAVDVVLSAKNTLSAAIQAVPQAALAWAGICIVLEMLANPIKATEANRKGIDYVVKRMDCYWNLSTSLLRDPTNNTSELDGMRGELENQIVDLYKALLSYQIKSVCAYYCNRGLVFLRDMIMLNDWKADLAAIQDAENCFQNDTQAYTNQQVTSRLEQLVSYTKHQEIQQMSEKDQQCLKHVRLTDPRHDKTRIEQTKGGLLQDSYRWVLDNAGFQKLRDDPQHRLLWIKGDPGKGKTMLLCGIINELDQGNTANARHCNVAYFFCQATDSRINNATAVLRGLIYLLIEQQPSVLSHVRKEYDRAGENLFKDANTWVALSNIFTNILQDSSLRTTYLIIDALDECITTDLPQLLDFIAQQTASESRVKWIVSSRNWPQIEERLERATDKVKVSLELNAESVAAAVNAFILHKVDQLEGLKKYSPATKKVVQDYLRTNAHDTFLWVALVCQALAGPEVKKWKTEEILRKFPPGLDALYAQMKQYISLSQDSDLCKRILAVTAIVRRPISLQELTTLVELPNITCDDLESVEEIIKLCGSFLTSREQTVYFVHQSAKDFLLGNASDKAGNQASQEAFKWIFPKGKEDVHYTLFLRSLSTMSTILRRDRYDLSAPGFSSDEVQIPDPDPLATVRYSCVYWVDHLCDSVFDTNTKQHDHLQENGIVYTFLKTKYLYWLEALSLLQVMPAGVIAIRKLEGLLGGNNQSQLSKLVWDAYRFALSYKPIIEQAPLQAYISALVFAPRSSLIKKNFRAEEPEWIQTKPAVELDWNACLQTLEGHDDCVYSVAFSPDGQRLASGSEDKTIKIWDPASGSCLQTLEGHSGDVYSVAFSPDGQRLASGSSDDTIKIWDPASGSCLQTLEGHSGYFGYVSSVAFSPDGQRLASGSYDKTIKIWDPASGSCLQTLEGHSNWVYSVAFSPDGQRLASGSVEKTIKIWDSASGSCLQTLEGHSGGAYSVAFSPDGQQLASGLEEKTIKIWDPASGSCLQTLEGHSNWVYSVAFSPDGQRLASGSGEKTIKIWDPASGSCLQTLEGHSGGVHSVAFSPDGQQLASGSEDKMIKIWDPASGSCLQTLEGHSGGVHPVAFSPDGQRLASCSEDKMIKIWDPASGSCLQTLEGHSNYVRSVAFSPDGQRLASGSLDDTIKIWDPASGSCLQTLEGHSGDVVSVAISPDGQRLAAGSYDNTIKIWDLASGSCVQTLEGHSGDTVSVAFSPDGQQLASGSYDNTIKIWDLASGKVQVMETSKAKLEADHPDTLTSMADLAFRWNSQGRHEDALALMQDHIEAEARERHPGDFDSDESVSSSDNDSVFSILSSLPSTSSQGSVTDIKVLLAQNFATLLSEDEALISLISAAKFQKRIGFERMRENFRKLLKYFALDLKAEISSDQHRAVVGFVSSYSANITRELFSTPSIIMDEVQILFPRSITKAYNTEDSRKKVEEYLSKEFAPDKPAKLVEPVESAKPNNQHHLNNLNEFTEPNEDSDQDSVDDGAGEEEPYDGSLEHLDQMKCFILESLAYQALRRRLHEFVYPSLRSRLRYLIAVWSKDDHKYHTYVTRYELSNLVAELQYIDPHEIRFYDGEEERGYVSKAINYFQNAVEHWTGEHWDWWPLAPYLRPLEGGETRISWECTCGEKRWAEVPLSFTKRLKSIIRKLPRSSIPLLPLQNPQSRPTPHPPTSSDQGAQRNNQTSGQSPGNNHRDQPPASQPQIAGGNGATVIGIGQPDRRVLFIVSQGIDYKLAQICITGLNDCQAFFGTLKENYFRLRGQLRSWFSIWRYSHCDFYKCEKFDDHEFAPKQKDSFPDAVNPDYEYQPKPIDSIPPVSKHEFQKRFYACHDTQGIHHRYHKCRILGHQSHGLLGYLPKKITELEEGGDKREVFWGIYAREIISLRWVLCYNFVCMFPMLVFFVCWVSPLGQNTDLQNPSVPISIMLSMLSLFWSIFLSSLQFGRSK